VQQRLDLANKHLRCPRGSGITYRLHDRSRMPSAVTGTATPGKRQDDRGGDAPGGSRSRSPQPGPPGGGHLPPRSDTLTMRSFRLPSIIANSFTFQYFALLRVEGEANAGGTRGNIGHAQRQTTARASLDHAPNADPRCRSGWWLDGRKIEIRGPGRTLRYSIGRLWLIRTEMDASDRSAPDQTRIKMGLKRPPTGLSSIP
jgi:hypothetical protein